MNSYLYTAVTLAHFAFEITMAIKVDDVGAVINFITTFSSSFMFFFIPSLLYYKACKMHPEKPKDKWLPLVSILNSGLGLVVFCLSLYSNVLALGS